MATSSIPSASSIVGGSVSGYHTLKIGDYARTWEIPNGEHIDSRPFLVGGRTWHVSYYPNGKVPKNIDSTSFFLTLDDTLAEAEAVKARFGFSLLDQHGRPAPLHSRTTQTADFSVKNTWGFGDFIKRIELLRSDCYNLEEDSFTVKVDVTIMRDLHAEAGPVEETPSTTTVLPPPDLHGRFQDLLSSKNGVDVEFRVGGETFSAHRFVLAFWSPVFTAQFYGPMKEGTTADAIYIDDMEPRVFRAMLSFMYTDTLPADMGQGEECAMAQHLLVAADRYDLDRLKLFCQGKLRSCIDTSSVATILALADQHHCRELKEACLNILKSLNNLEEAMDSEGFEVLMKSCPGIIKDLLKSLVSLLGKRKSRE